MITSSLRDIDINKEMEKKTKTESDAYISPKETLSISYLENVSL